MSARSALWFGQAVTPFPSAQGIWRNVGLLQDYF
jgi:hypothetical protein